MINIYELLKCCVDGGNCDVTPIGYRSFVLGHCFLIELTNGWWKSFMRVGFTW